uniref:POT1PC domain-containing protein n=1 Tax=Wuchereria bancrofti TaxID=6293 RepID=A0A1I8F030_WUCBA
IKKKTDGKLVVYGKLKVAGFAVLLFSGELGDSFTPVYQSSATFTLVSNYEEMISSLRMLSVSNQSMTIPIEPMNSNLGHISEGKINEIIENVNVLRLNELVLGGYSDLVVQLLLKYSHFNRTHILTFKRQAISLFIDDRNSVVLRCWDTTLPSKKIFMFNDDMITEVICQDEKMEMIPMDYWCDIVLYEEHANFARNSVKCGDVLLLINTHLYHSKSGVALVMHNGGQSYNRSIVILDANSKLKRDLLRLRFILQICYIETFPQFPLKKLGFNIDEFNIQIDTEDRRNVESVEQYPYTGLQQVIPTPSLDEMNDLENEQRELSEYWAGERMRQIHALQLAWIYAYAYKKKRNESAQLQRSFNLAVMAVQFIVRQTFERLFTCNKDLFVNFTKLSCQQRNIILTKFFLKYIEGAFDDEITLKLTKSIQETTDEDKQSDGKNSKVMGDLLGNLLPGTVLKLSSWQVTFSYDENTKIFFVLICYKCNLWCTTSAKNFDMTPLCPVCFKRTSILSDAILYIKEL